MYIDARKPELKSLEKSISQRFPVDAAQGFSKVIIIINILSFILFSSHISHT